MFVALPISTVAIGSMAYFLRQSVSPCVMWAGSNSASVHGNGSHGCREITGVGQTRLQAAVEKVAVPGVILIAAVLGVWGTARSRQTVVIVAGLLMLLEMIPTGFSVWPLALLAGIGFLVIANRMPERAASRP